MKQARVPEVARSYFALFGIDEHPVIQETFIPGRGWRRYPIRKRVSQSWSVKLRREGVTRVQLAAGGHFPDFDIRELTRG